MPQLRNRSKEPQSSLRRRLVRRFRAARIDASAPQRNKRGIAGAGFDLKVAGLRVRALASASRNLPDVMIEKLAPVDLAVVERQRGEQFVVCRLEVFEDVLRRAEAGDGSLIPEEPDDDDQEEPRTAGLKINLRGQS